MDPTRLALEANLADNPDDLVAHAAYADWLIENGDTRGEYIRGIVALQDPALTTVQRTRLARSLVKYAKTHEKEWFGQLLQYVKPDWWPLEARLCQAVNEHVIVKLDRGWILSMYLESPEPEVWQAVANSPMSRFIRLLIVSEHAELFSTVGAELFSTDGAEWVGHLSHFHALRHLTVHQIQFADDGVDRLLASGIVSQLKELHLVICGITDDGALALAADPHIRKLKRLELVANYISPIGREALAAVGFDIGSQYPIHRNHHHHDEI